MKSVVVPAYNEEDVIQHAVEKLSELFDEVIVVSDGVDMTGEIARNAGATVVEFLHRIGKGAAIKAGISRATGDVVGFVDADIPFTASDISLVSDIGLHGLACAWRKDWHKSFYRNVGRLSLNLLSSILHGRFPDYQAGMKFFPSKYKSIAMSTKSSSYFFDTELVASFIRHGIPVIPVKVRWENRAHGKPVFSDSLAYTAESLSLFLRRF